LLPPPITGLSASGKQFGEIIAFLTVTATAITAAVTAAIAALAAGRKIA
jgi:hypothetical protein